MAPLKDLLVALVNLIDGKPGEEQQDGAFMFFGAMAVYVFILIAGLYRFFQDQRAVELLWRHLH